MSLIGEVENSSRERALVAQRLETAFLTVRSRVWFPPGSVGAHRVQASVFLLQPLLQFARGKFSTLARVLLKLDG